MAKYFNKGKFFTNAYKVEVPAPLDIRSVVPTVSDLYNDSYEDSINGGALGPFVYDGMIVVVADKGQAVPYLLIDSTRRGGPEGWKKLVVGDDLTGAMHFIGVAHDVAGKDDKSVTLPVVKPHWTEEKTVYVTSTKTSWEPGDVITYNKLEFIYASGAWQLNGDDDLGALESEIERVDKTHSAAIVDLDKRVAAMESESGVNEYSQEITSTIKACSVTIEEADHQCGKQPMIAVYYCGNLVDVDQSINFSTGAVTISWSNTTKISEVKPLVIKMTGVPTKI